jgi:hypothetical protein
MAGVGWGHHLKHIPSQLTDSKLKVLYWPEQLAAISH